MVTAFLIGVGLFSVVGITGGVILLCDETAEGRGKVRSIWFGFNAILCGFQLLRRYGYEIAEALAVLCWGAVSDK